jgi:hypothetical protein
LQSARRAWSRVRTAGESRPDFRAPHVWPGARRYATAAAALADWVTVARSMASLRVSHAANALGAVAADSRWAPAGWT